FLSVVVVVVDGDDRPELAAARIRRRSRSRTHPADRLPLSLPVRPVRDAVGDREELAGKLVLQAVVVVEVELPTVRVPRLRRIHEPLRLRENPELLTQLLRVLDHLPLRLTVDPAGNALGVLLGNPRGQGGLN